MRSRASLGSRSRCSRCLVVCAVVLSVLVVGTSSASAAVRQWSNPVSRFDNSDPSIIRPVDGCHTVKVVVADGGNAELDSLDWFGAPSN